MLQQPKKIVAIGPECTGKSTLCELLSQRFNTAWVPEFAREYLLTHGKDYSYDDLLTIAKGQIASEEDYIQSITGNRKPANENPPHSPLSTPHSPLFIDTDMYVMKVWCEFVFGKCHQWIIDQIVSRKYDLYLLCNTDLPWVKDELREYPDLETREKLFHIYKDIMINQNTSWVEIGGNYDQRAETAIEAINKLIAPGKK